MEITITGLDDIPAYEPPAQSTEIRLDTGNKDFDKIVYDTLPVARKEARSIMRKLGIRWLVIFTFERSKDEFCLLDAIELESHDAMKEILDIDNLFS